MENNDEKILSLAREVCLSPTFFGWIFQFCGKIRIVAPKAAVEKYQAMLDTATGQYSGSQKLQ